MTIRLKNETADEIRDRLNYISESIHRKEPKVSELEWSYKTIQDLLYIIYSLQEVDDNEKE